MKGYVEAALLSHLVHIVNLFHKTTAANPVGWSHDH